MLFVPIMLGLVVEEVVCTGTYAGGIVVSAEEVAETAARFCSMLLLLLLIL